MHLWAILAYTCALALLAQKILLPRLRASARRPPPLPPSPPARPFTGHLHLLTLPLHRCLHRLAQAHGPILYLRTGSLPTVVASSAPWARLFLHAHERDFADRPHGEASRRLFYGNRTVVTMEHGPQWRETRKLYTVQMLSMKRVDMFKAARREEMARALEALAAQGGPVQVRKVVFRAVGNMVSRMLLNKRLFGDGDGDGDASSCFGEMVEEMAALFGAPIIGDLIPCLSWLDLGGYKRRMTRLSLRLDSFLEHVLEETTKETGVDQIHPFPFSNVTTDSTAPDNFPSADITEITPERSNTKEKTAPSSLNTLSDLCKDHNATETRNSIKAIILDLLSAGTETTTTTIEWAMAELVTNPRCMKKLQEELATTAVKQRSPSRNDDSGSKTDRSVVDRSPIGDEVVMKLPYLQAVIKETLRLHPPLPVLVRQMRKHLPHGKEVGGYHVPARAKVLVNVWALGRDRAIWGEDAQAFCPDRFLDSGSAYDLRGKHHEFLPFGSGRRGCPGMNLGLSMIGLVLANFVQFFDWRLPDDSGMPDMSEAASRTAPMATPLQATPFHRHCQPNAHS